MIIKINDNGFLSEFDEANFICVISSIETTLYYPISGVHRDYIRYTPALDVELVFLGKTLTLKNPPVDSSLSPSPAVISRACIELLDVKNLHINAGSFVKPKIPYINLDENPTGRIEFGKAMENSKDLFKYGYMLGKNLEGKNLIIGESVPGGTTTALGVLRALNYNAKVSSGSIKNPHKLKEEIIGKGLGYIKNRKDIFSILNAVGDKMMPVVAGLVKGFRGNILLAGGTQMAAVLAVIKEIDKSLLEKVALATTEFVLYDKNSNLVEIVKDVGDLPIYAAKFDFEKSKLEGLKKYCEGAVKEGVGAGGLAVYAMNKGIKNREIREFIEENIKKWYP
ncbi:nicotinate mononucleotide-dependent phosphoribosyltransferase CobT [Methanocaldococcus sp.]